MGGETDFPVLRQAVRVRLEGNLHELGILRILVVNNCEGNIHHKVLPGGVKRVINGECAIDLDMRGIARGEVEGEATFGLVSHPQLDADLAIALVPIGLRLGEVDHRRLVRCNCQRVRCGIADAPSGQNRRAACDFAVAAVLDRLADAESDGEGNLLVFGLALRVMRNYDRNLETSLARGNCKERITNKSVLVAGAPDINKERINCPHRIRSSAETGVGNLARGRWSRKRQDQLGVLCAFVGDVSGLVRHINGRIGGIDIKSDSIGSSLKGIGIKDGDSVDPLARVNTPALRQTYFLRRVDNRRAAVRNSTGIGLNGERELDNALALISCGSSGNHKFKTPCALARINRDVIGFADSIHIRNGRAELDAPDGASAFAELNGREGFRESHADHVRLLVHRFGNCAGLMGKAHNLVVVGDIDEMRSIGGRDARVVGFAEIVLILLSRERDRRIRERDGDKLVAHDVVCDGDRDLRYVLAFIEGDGGRTERDNAVVLSLDLDTDPSTRRRTA